tara:strand:- start:672 stop:1136 length:465 start_codon:yes stop_codon:yes gene_type:complete
MNNLKEDIFNKNKYKKNKNLIKFVNEYNLGNKKEIFLNEDLTEDNIKDYKNKLKKNINNLKFLMKKKKQIEIKINKLKSENHKIKLKLKGSKNDNKNDNNIVNKAKAIKNYALFHDISINNVDIKDIYKSSAGLDGWVNYNHSLELLDLKNSRI